MEYCLNVLHRVVHILIEVEIRVEFLRQPISFSGRAETFADQLDGFHARAARGQNSGILQKAR
jgi:hypothetical protein